MSSVHQLNTAQLSVAKFRQNSEIAFACGDQESSVEQAVRALLAAVAPGLPITDDQVGAHTLFSVHANHQHSEDAAIGGRGFDTKYLRARLFYEGVRANESDKDLGFTLLNVSPPQNNLATDPSLLVDALTFARQVCERSLLFAYPVATSAAELQNLRNIQRDQFPEIELVLTPVDDFAKTLTRGQNKQNLVLVTRNDASILEAVASVVVGPSANRVCAVISSDRSHHVVEYDPSICDDADTAFADVFRSLVFLLTCSGNHRAAAKLINAWKECVSFGMHPIGVYHPSPYSHALAPADFVDALIERLPQEDEALARRQTFRAV
ncbi:MAG: hypothetical protein AAGF15_02185 [Pseudomonadota bacterium]